MAVPSKLSKPEGPGAGRRSTRISIAIPITITGKDANGRPFKENTRTVILNKHGAKIVTVHQLALGAEVLLENRALGRTAKTTVAWLGDPQSSREPTEIGIQLIEAENIWGIDLPPDDWQEGPPPKEARQEIRQTPGPAAPAIPSASPSAPQAPHSTAAPSRPRPTAGPPAPTPRVPAESPARSDPAARTQARIQESTTQPERPQDKAIEQQVREIEKRLDATRAELEALQAKFQESREPIDVEISKTQRDGQASFALAVQNASGELNEKVRQSLEAITAKAEEYQAHLSRQTGSVLEELQTEAGSLLRSFHAQFDRALSEAQDKATRDVLDRLQRTSNELVEALSKNLQIKASSSIEPLFEELRAASGTTVAEGRKQLSILRQQMLEGVEKEALNLAEEQKIRLRKTLQDFQDQGTHEINDSVKRMLEKHREAILSQFQTQLEQAFHASHEKSLRKFKESIREEQLKQLEEAAAEFDKRTQENLELFIDQMNEKKEEIVTQAAEMFRSKIGQMSLALQAGAKKASEGEGGKERG